MRQSWGDFLKGAGRESHGVQVYEEAADLADSVAAYLVAGFTYDHSHPSTEPRYRTCTSLRTSRERR